MIDESMLPGWRDWAFAAKAFLAAMIALAIAMWAGLDRPYWAMASVYVAAQPLTGATRSKATYRLLGTLVGATAAIVLIPNLVNAPVLLTLAMAGWSGLCLVFALLERTPRSYVFMLAAYTTPIIGFPAVDQPELIWGLALARSEEICLGIVCAAVIMSVVLPVHVGPVIVARTGGWLRLANEWGERILTRRDDPAKDRAQRRRLIADLADIDMLATHLGFDSSLQRTAGAGIRALRGRMLMLVPRLSSAAEAIAMLRAAGPLTPALATLLDSVSAWLRAPADEAREGAVTDALLAQVDAAEPPIDPTMNGIAITQSGLCVRLREIIEITADCRLLNECIAQGKLVGRVGLRYHPDAELRLLRHRDIGMALFSALAAALSIGLVCLFWIVSGWPEGAGAAQMAAVACAFFSTQDNPTTGIAFMLRWVIVSILFAALYLFAILPMADGMVMLVIALAPAFLLFGVLAGRPATMMIGMLLGATTASLLGLQGRFAADFASFANGSVATAIGIGSAAVTMGLFRRVGAEWSAWRLTRANWRLLATAARRRGAGDRTTFASLIIDRFALALPRLGAIPETSLLQQRDAMRDLRLGLNIVDLRRARHALAADAVGAVDELLASLARYLGSAARAGAAAAAPPATLFAAIDEAIGIVVTGRPHTMRRDALLGLAGIRHALFPDAATYEPRARVAALGRVA